MLKTLSEHEILMMLHLAVARTGVFLTDSSNSLFSVSSSDVLQAFASGWVGVSTGRGTLMGSVEARTNHVMKIAMSGVLLVLVEIMHLGKLETVRAAPPAESIIRQLYRPPVSSHTISVPPNNLLLWTGRHLTIVSDFFELVYGYQPMRYLDFGVQSTPELRGFSAYSQFISRYPVEKRRVFRSDGRFNQEVNMVHRPYNFILDQVYTSGFCIGHEWNSIQLYLNPIIAITLWRTGNQSNQSILKYLGLCRSFSFNHSDGAYVVKPVNTEVTDRHYDLGTLFRSTNLMYMYEWKVSPSGVYNQNKPRTGLSYDLSEDYMLMGYAYYPIQDIPDDPLPGTTFTSSRW
jgi:hypothetical protein